MNGTSAVLGLCLLTVALQPVQAAEEALASHWVTDRTVSAMGKDFFRRFEAGWQEEVLPREVAISVVERPSARLGNLVQVEYGQYLLYRGVLSQTRRWTIESLAEQAVPAAAQRLTELILLSRYETDLGKDEF